MLPPTRTILASAALLLSATGLVACGESSEEKAAKNVCSSVKEIDTQLAKLQALTISTSFPAEAKSSVETIGTSIKKIDESAPKLETARREEIETANKAFAAGIATISASVISAAKASNLQEGLKGAEGQIKTELSKLASAYKASFEALKCS